MKFNGLILISFICFTALPTQAQSAKWKGKKCAVVLTYDDALAIHLDQVIPALDSLDLKATFYLSVAYPGSKERINDWRKAATKGHELGNHTMYHPCNGSLPGREWVNPDYDLSKYTLSRMVDEIRMTNAFLESIDGKKYRTFAYPCGDLKAGDTSYVESIQNDFVAARGVSGEILQPETIKFFDVGSYAMSGNSGEEMIALVKNAMAEGGLIVFLFHGVGGQHPINVSRAEHKKLIVFLKQHEKELWVAPLVDVMKYVKNKKESPAKKRTND